MSLEDVRQSAAAGQLAVVLGAGATMALMPKSRKALAWTELVGSSLEYGHARSLINDVQLKRYREMLDSEDIDELLGVAEFAGRKLGAPTGTTYARWMRSVFESWQPEAGAMTNALRAIVQKRILLATLNYDTVTDDAIRMLPVELSETEAVLAWCRKEREGVLHFHGVWTQPGSCVFGIRDYQTTLNNQVRDLVQRSLSALNRILFVGCGDTFADPNFSALISWLRTNIGPGAPQHYALVRNDEVARRLADPTWRGFVEPLGYGDAYNHLPAFLLDCFPTRPVGTSRAARAKASADRHSHTIDAYRNFLLRDCGEMTIEGMRADMDTAQRKFDLEKLFVPLQVQPLPPAIPLTDPDRETKLQDWREKHGDPIPFAAAFAKHRQIALLALPGGGKTLLLKRLAVAYCDAKRRTASPDALPDLDLVPVMIRCREWKEHIRKPFATLLQEVAAITGDQKLQGLFEALEKPLKSGNVLLLVDGLDEIHDDGDRTIFVENLENFLDQYPKTRLLVSSREAGFDLVAPCVARFCDKLKIAPLNADAIKSLTDHWHRLMSGGSVEALAEAADVANTLLTSPPLRRLAENPLLLTMLLVVKHGAGRLPPDRVSLYDRAVEVLLDTWNIKGHEALNTKEAVPQLACLAFELMRRGKQTATEQEILEILETARAELPMIGRYAKDSTHEFLKRVELRSSLMLEGGHTSENGRTVPFYQFRHLTFQEYLAAVAAVEGYVLGASRPHLLLTTIGEDLLSEEWKEVVPMAAVLARAQAGPLLEALTIASESEWQMHAASIHDRALDDPKVPPATLRLGQSMIEEAVFPSDILVRAARTVAFFGNSGRVTELWQPLGRGPYGGDLRRAALDNYLERNVLRMSAARTTLAWLEVYAQPADFSSSEASVGELLAILAEPEIEARVRGLAATGGTFLIMREQAATARSHDLYDALEAAIFDDRPEVYLFAAWSWGFWRHLNALGQSCAPTPSNQTVNRLTKLFVKGLQSENDAIGFAFSDFEGTRRGDYALELDAQELELLRQSVVDERARPQRIEKSSAILRIAFLMPEFFSDHQVIEFVQRMGSQLPNARGNLDIYEHFGLEHPKGARQQRSARKPSRPANSRLSLDGL